MTDAPTVRLARTALYAGLAAGVLDIIAAVVTNLQYPAQVIFQSVASGWLGAAAYQGGWPAAWLGLASHFGIMLVIAVIYVVLAWRRPRLRHLWIRASFVWGAVVWAVMALVVVPLSASTLPMPDAVGALKAIAIHVVCVGWPMAWIARRMLGAPPPKAPSAL